MSSTTSTMSAIQNSVTNITPMHPQKGMCPKPSRPQHIIAMASFAARRRGYTVHPFLGSMRGEVLGNCEW